MTLSGTIRYIERVARMQPAIKTVVPNDIFRLNSLPDVKYAVFGWTQGQHSIGVDDSYATYAFTFFYVDRLTEDKGNELEVQSVGIQVLDNIIRVLEQAGAHIAGAYTLTTFNQRFLDECAGVYTQVSIQVPLNGICEEGYFDDDEDDGPWEPIDPPCGCSDCPPLPENLLKYRLCESKEEYEAIQPKDGATIYLIKKQA